MHILGSGIYIPLKYVKRIVTNILTVNGVIMKVTRIVPSNWAFYLLMGFLKTTTACDLG